MSHENGLKYLSEQLNIRLEQTNSRLESIEADLQELLHSRSYLMGQARASAFIVSVIVSICAGIVSFFMKG